MRFPRPLPELFREEMAGTGLAERLREAEIWAVWPDAVGPVVALRARPLRIINGILTVAVSGAPWMQELRFLAPMMKEKLNQRLGGEVIRGISLKAATAGREEQEPEDAPLCRKPLTDRQLALVAEQAAGIADPETRDAFMALMRTALEHDC